VLAALEVLYAGGTSSGVTTRCVVWLAFVTVLLGYWAVLLGYVAVWLGCCAVLLGSVAVSWAMGLCG
jgi:hypothetical protein